MTDLNDRLVIVTGANSGVGFSLSRMLLESGARVVMVCRSRERGDAALARLGRPDNAALEISDVSRMDDVRSLADRLLERGDLYALVNNAGVWRNRLERTPEGHEVTMATNHLGHFLLTDLLLDRVLAGGRRVVNVSSEAHRRGKLARAPIEDIMSGAAWSGGLQAYSDSKQANVMFTSELVRRYGDRGLIANALHPGVLATRIWNKNPGLLTVVMRMFKLAMGSPDVGGKAILRVLRDPELADVNDAYFKVEKIGRAEPSALDPAVAGRLWEVSERLTR